VTRILGDEGISIEAMLQKEPPAEEEGATIIMLTQRVVEANMDRAIGQIQGLDSILSDVIRIRVESLG